MKITFFHTHSLPICDTAVCRSACWFRTQTTRQLPCGNWAIIGAINMINYCSKLQLEPAWFTRCFYTYTFLCQPVRVLSTRFSCVWLLQRHGLRSCIDCKVPLLVSRERTFRFQWWQESPQVLGPHQVLPPFSSHRVYFFYNDFCVLIKTWSTLEF